MGNGCVSGGGCLYILTLRKSAKDGAPERLWLVEVRNKQMKPRGRWSTRAVAMVENYLGMGLWRFQCSGGRG